MGGSFSAARYFPGILGKQTEPNPATAEDSGALPPELVMAQPLAPEAPAMGWANGANVRAESPCKTSDEALMESITAHDDQALASLFRRYARMVRALAYRILRDGAEADDLLQEVFLFIHRKSGNFDSAKGSARSWIVHLAYERAIDRRRYLNTRHFYTTVELDDAATELPDPRAQELTSAEALDAILAKNDLQRALDALPDGQRQTLQLYFFEGYTLSEIAVKLGQTVGNVRNHYYRGLEKLRQQVFAKKLQGAASV